MATGLVGVLALLAAGCGPACEAGRGCTIAGVGTLGFNGDGLPADETWLSSPTSVLTDADGTVLIVDFSNMRIRELTAEGTIETRVGIGEHAYSEIGADRLETPLENPIDAAYGPDGLLYLAPLHEGRVIRVGAHDTIEVVAGTGEIADGVHGGATLETPMGYVAGIAFGPDGSLYAADQTFSRVRRVGPDGRVECVLGLGQAGENGVGAGPETALAYPERIVVDAPRSRLLVADAGNHRVLAMDLDSLQTEVVAGTGVEGFSGDGGAAVDAQLSLPMGLAVQSDGRVYVSDFGNHVVRAVFPDGTIDTVLGDPEAEDARAVAWPLQARIHGPAGLHLTAEGDLLVAERAGHRIARFVGADHAP